MIGILSVAQHIGSSIGNSSLWSNSHGGPKASVILSDRYPRLTVSQRVVGMRYLLESTVNHGGSEDVQKITRKPNRRLLELLKTSYESNCGFVKYGMEHVDGTSHETSVSLDVSLDTLGIGT